ncbi:MAG TPA: glycoside hydrolase domain-containing protein, partial [Streptosporangiaceae bacterium]|nr:glycoside hydrolase domain-containing protein [Streptosporangiaceae bacterium]
MVTMILPRRGRQLLGGTLVLAGVLAGGWQASAGGWQASAGGPTDTPAGTCAKTSSGQLVNCPEPAPGTALPAAVRNTATVTSPIANLAALADTRTWTTGGGNTYPGAEVPFGMVQWSPDTMPGRADGGGYTYGNTRLTGYSLTHISGVGCRAAGDIPILPMTGPLPSGNPTSVTTSFTNTGEVAQAGYYSAHSNAPATITSQFSATPHSAIGRFTFPRTTAADFLVKLRDSQLYDTGSSVQVIGNDEVTGSASSGGFCDEASSRVGPQNYTVYFDIIFSQPFTASRVITETGQTDPNSVFLTFDTTSDQVIDAKVAISYVSTANARLNWQTEAPGWDLPAVKKAAQGAWNGLLGRIRVSGGSFARTQEFYSLLYKDFLQPQVTSDVNGQYLGSDQAV